MQAIVDFLLLHATNKKVWAGAVGLVLAVTGFQATAVQTEQLVAGITAILAVILPFLHSPTPKE
jgi:Na+/melibiose symporter-like transporter